MNRNGDTFFLVLTSLLLVSTNATADILEEIVVVAQKREQNIQDVGIAITAFSGDQLEAFGFQESTDIVAMTPGVTVGGSIAGQFLTVNIRGVSQNDFADHVESPNAVYIDDTYISFPQFQKFALLDTERVEILKGPQGTLFGRNATGGLVHYISKAPTEDFEAYTKFTYGSYNQTKIEGGVSGPLSDGVNGRISLLYNQHDEILNNLIGPDEWNDDTVMGKAQLAWTIGDNVDARLSLIGGRTETSNGPYQNEPLIAIFDADGSVIDTQPAGPTETRAGIGPGGVDMCPGCFFVGPRPTPGGDGFGYLDADGDEFDVSKDFADDDGTIYSMVGGSLKLDWTLDNGLTVTSITDFKTFDKENTRLDVDASPVNVLSFYADAENDQFSQEIRLAGESETRRWLLGLYYLDIDVLSRQGVGGPTTVAGPNIFGAFDGVDYFNTASVDTQSTSFFGQIEYDLSDEWTAIFGLRATQEDKDFVHTAFAVSSDDRSNVLVPVLEAGPPALVNAQQLDSSDTLWSGRLQLNWVPRDGLLWYGSINQGAKAGGFNQQLGGLFAVSQFAYDPEELTAYEIGVKSTIFNNKARLNAAVYYYDYRDYQAFSVNGLSFTVINADANYNGLEIELASSPTENLDLGISFSYIDATVEDVPFAAGPGGTSVRLLDREPTFTPEIQVSGLAKYQWTVSNNANLSVQVDFSYSDDSFYNLTNFGGAELDSSTIGNVRLGYTSPDDTWSLQAYVKNFTDERVDLVGFDFSTFCGCKQAGFAAPRWAGLTYSYNWE